VVDDVLSFPGHIACDSRSRSEIVVPLFGATGTPIGVLDVDSHRPAHFDHVDRLGYETVVRTLEKHWKQTQARDSRETGSSPGSDRNRRPTRQDRSS
jgi:putative methionine-R-sulfoxide reductase with GAF domain